MICELLFPSSILAVKLNRKTLVIVLENEIYIYDISNMRLQHVIETTPNPEGASLLHLPIHPPVLSSCGPGLPIPPKHVYTRTLDTICQVSDLPNVFVRTFTSWMSWPTLVWHYVCLPENVSSLPQGTRTRVPDVTRLGPTKETEVTMTVVSLLPS